MNILIVDDDPGTTELLGISASLWGYFADKAVNAEEAAERLQEKAYDVLITDAEMPGMSGFELCRHVRSRFPHMFIIGITGSLDFHKFQEVGADTFFQKPFKLENLQEVLKNIPASCASEIQHPATGSLKC